MSNTISNRQAICEYLVGLADTDKDVVILTSDSRGSAGLAPFYAAHPGQTVETGIAEQNIVGIAAGMARCGKKPVVASPASFLSTRAAEQVKVDVAYSHTNVVLLGISGGVSYGALGMSHHSVQDVAFMRAVPGIDVILPCDRFESVEVFRDLMAHPRPAYVRIGRNAVEDVFSPDCVRYERGKATKLCSGKRAAIIACGELVRPALDAAEALKKQGIDISVYDMHTIKPLDEAAVLEAAGTGFILTMEEASVNGGLGEAVCAVAMQSGIPCKAKLLGIPDEPAIAGTSKEVFAYYGLTADNAQKIIKANI